MSIATVLMYCLVIVHCYSHLCWAHVSTLQTTGERRGPRRFRIENSRSPHLSDGRQRVQHLCHYRQLVKVIITHTRLTLNTVSL